MTTSFWKVNMLDISNNNYERIFVTGKLLGDSLRFMRFLYEQNFNYKDALVICGDIIDIENIGDSITLLEFIKSNNNCYATMGDQEYKYIKYTNNDELRHKVHYQLLDKAESTYKDFISELPAIIKITDDTYAVHAGVNPIEGIHTKDEETYYMIGAYDGNSRFYQFINPEKKNWFDFKIFDGEQQLKIVFSATDTPTIDVPAGYSLYRSEQVYEPLKCMIYTQNSDPILLEVN